MDLYTFDSNIREEGFVCLAGVDEAGRGPLAGPVVAAACILPEGFFLSEINDSKALTHEQREQLYNILTSHPNVQYGLGVQQASQIDQKNILRATFDAMNQAIDSLPTIPDLLLIDGKFLPKTQLPARAIVKGDGRSLSIAAASIIAKHTRDRMMIEIDRKWPQYGFKSHKGYGTPEHMSAVKKNGPLEGIHRKSFQPIQAILTPDLFAQSGGNIDD
jgi:ribonuclease HII